MGVIVGEANRVLLAQRCGSVGKGSGSWHFPVANALMKIVTLLTTRSILIHLTDKGQELLEGILNEDSLIIQKINDVMELPEEEIQHLMRLHRLVLSKLTLEEEWD